jgi:hypothetical protein
VPYASRAQQGYFHAALARHEISPKVVKEFDKASKGKKGLPYHARKKARHHKSVMKGLSGY